MDTELNKIAGFTVECYPTLRSEKEPILPTRLRYEIYSTNDVKRFVHSSFCDTASFTENDDKEMSFFNIVSTRGVNWKKYLSAKKIEELSTLDYYNGFIWLHMKISFIYVSEDANDEKIFEMLRTHDADKLDFDTEAEHFAHNEFGLDHISKPGIILVDKIQPVRGSDGYFIMMMKKKFSAADWYVNKLFHMLA